MRRIIIALSLLVATAASTALANETDADLIGAEKPAAELRVDSGTLGDTLTAVRVLRTTDEAAPAAEEATFQSEFVPLPYDD